MSEKPVIIEAALSPLRLNAEEQVYANDELKVQAIDCLAAGAGIIHHHHDTRLDAAGTAAEMIGLGKAIQEKFPDALFYGDFVRSDTFEGKMAHFPALADAGTMTMVGIDPGAAAFGALRKDGTPYTIHRQDNDFEKCNKVLDFAIQHNRPVSVGIFEPGSIRWAVAHARKGNLPKGSMVKFFMATYVDTFDGTKQSLNYGLPPTKAAVDAYVEMLDGTGLPWIVSAFGAVMHEMPLMRHIMEKGGHVRVGVEDACGLTSFTSAECVAAAVEIANQVGRPVAKHSETLDVLARG